jgi:hypothetical protein
MPSELQKLAMAVLARSHAKRDTAWDRRGTIAGQVSQGAKVAGTAKTRINQGDNPAVPLSQSLGDGTLGRPANSGTLPGTVVGRDDRDHVATVHGRETFASAAAMIPAGDTAPTEFDSTPFTPFASALAALRAQCPTYVPEDRWRQAITDATAFATEWGGEAQTFGWTAAEVFGLHPVQKQPAANCDRLARLDDIGVVWLLRGRPVVALTATEASYQCPSGAILTYRRERQA